MMESDGIPGMLKAMRAIQMSHAHAVITRSAPMLQSLPKRRLSKAVDALGKSDRDVKEEIVLGKEIVEIQAI